MTFQESISKAIESQRNRLGITAQPAGNHSDGAFQAARNFTPVLLHA